MTHNHTMPDKDVALIVAFVGRLHSAALDRLDNATTSFPDDPHVILYYEYTELAHKAEKLLRSYRPDLFEEGDN